MSLGPSAWPQWVPLGELAAGGREHPFRRRLVADPAARATVAEALGLEALGGLEADIEARGWFDGAVIEGRWRAEITQICGITLEPFDSVLEGRFTVRVTPAGSPHAPPRSAGGEIVVDPEAEDPPDVLETDSVDVGDYVVEHLALEIDPFPRKPGAVFEPPPPEPEASPFAVLRGLKPDGSPS